MVIALDIVSPPPSSSRVLCTIFFVLLMSVNWSNKNKSCINEDNEAPRDLSRNRVVGQIGPVYPRSLFI